MLHIHLNSEFSYSLSIVYAHNIINENIKEGVQKTFAVDHFQLVQKICISINFLGSLGPNTDVFCIGLQKNPIEGQKIDIRSKLFVRGHFEATTG